MLSWLIFSLIILSFLVIIIGDQAKQDKKDLNWKEVLK